jgi:hypothetical protein
VSGCNSKTAELTYVAVLARKYNEFVELRDISEEVIHSRSFRGSPTVLTLKQASVGKCQHSDYEVLTSHVDVISRSSREIMRVSGFWWGGGYGGGSSSGHAGLLKYYVADE